MKRIAVRVTNAPIVTIISRLSVILADAVVIIVIWRATFRIFRETSRLGFTSTVSTVLLRDGRCNPVVSLRIWTDAPDLTAGSACFVCVLKMQRFGAELTLDCSLLLLLNVTQLVVNILVSTS